MKALILLLFPFFIYSQQTYVEINAPNHIKGIELWNLNAQSHSPILNVGENFQISFDDLDSSFQKYFYTIKHYDKDWKESDLMDSQIIDGFFYEEIIQYENSFSTLQNYIHYSFQFPSQNLKPKISGNYALIVYTENKNKPIFTRKFFIVENLSKLALKKDIFNAGSKNLPNQIIRTKAIVSNINQLQTQNIYLKLYQNTNLNYQIEAKPQFIQSNGIEFNQLENVFLGGNEFLFFDTKNLTNAGLTTEKIINNKLVEIYLYPNVPFPLDYEYNIDVDGEYFIRRNDVGTERNAAIEGDYTWVNFALKIEKTETPIYIVGSFNNFQCLEENKLEFNEEFQLYEKSILLKQGYYNYTFTTKEKNKTGMNDLLGNFWETQNTYQALLYYKDFNGNYDRLLGFGEIVPWRNASTSIKKIF